MQRYIALNALPNTTETDATITEISLQKGMIEYVNVIFPPGSVGLLHLQLFIHGEQVSPWNKTGSIIGNNVTIQAIKNYPLSQPPYIIIARLWNLDDTYDHSVLLDIMESDTEDNPISDFILGL